MNSVTREGPNIKTSKIFGWTAKINYNISTQIYFLIKLNTIAKASLSHPSHHILNDVSDYLYSLIINEMT